MSRKLKGTLGILALDEHSLSPAPPAHTFNFPEWFPYSFVERKVPGAHPGEVVGGNLSLAAEYAQTARELERQGVTAITADCGFAIAYQDAVRNAVSVPVACSPLMQLPLIRTMLPARGRIGILTYDKSRLVPEHFHSAGVDMNELPLAIIGCEGTKLWQNWIGPTVTTDWEDFDRTVMGRARQLIRENPDVTHILLECCGFPRCAPQIRAETGLPVFDWVSLCNQVMEAAGSTD